MNLLDQEIEKEEPKGKKIILFSLIFLVFLLIIIIIIIFALSENRTKSLTLSVNGSDIKIDDDLLTTDSNGINYISINKISQSIGYSYYTGQYRQYNEDTTNTTCYIENEDQAIEFKADSNTIYKIAKGSNLDYEEYELNNKILQINNILYIALDDVNVGLNITCGYSQNDNKILLNTVDNLAESYSASFEEDTNSQYTSISDSFNNQKAICYNMLVVSNQNQKWGVIDSNFNTVIGNRYTTMEFNETTQSFIVSDENKYGVISKEGQVLIDLKYEEIKIISNSPLYYQFKLNGKYGIVDKEGNVIINNEYSSMGYYSDDIIKESVVTIEDLGKNEINVLVVEKDEKYGLLNLDDGSTIIECALDKVYGKTEDGEKQYYVEIQEREFSLNEYIDRINTTVVDVGR